MSDSREMTSYNRAEQRCNNPNDQGYARYGGRGVRFLFTSFQQFFAELGPRPEGMTLDRINNDGHYEPGNVRWATRSEQNRNRRRGVRGGWKQTAESNRKRSETMKRLANSLKSSNFAVLE